MGEAVKGFLNSRVSAYTGPPEGLVDGVLHAGGSQLGSRRCKRFLVEIYQVLRHDTQYIPTGLGYIQLIDAESTSRRRVWAIPEHHPSRPRRLAQNAGRWAVWAGGLQGQC